MKIIGRNRVVALLVALWGLGVAVPAMAASEAAAPVAIDLTAIITALLGVLATLVTAYVVPWLRGKIGEENYRRSLAMIETLVKAAEQLYGAGKGQEKLQYVKGEMIKRGMTLDADAIEAAVYELSRAFAPKVDGKPDPENPSA
ncbi:MAG: phage holin, LLH family [Clostridia bacterium]